MARLTDSQGRLLGGRPVLRFGSTPTPDSASRMEKITQPPLSRRYGPEETVPGLECSFGAGAYASAVPRRDEAPARRACHNPVEDPDERHHCERCGGDYCAQHADPTDHDCANIIHAS